MRKQIYSFVGIIWIAYLRNEHFSFEEENNGKS